MSIVSSQSLAYDVESAVRDRYAAGAQQPQASLCCPTDYDKRYLEVIPAEIIEKDYGCGDPTRYVNAGETVVDLGSGAGKNCYIIAQKVGAQGRVIGVDFNDAMLDLARRYRGEISAKLGFDNVKFLKGKIQDLKLDLEQLQSWLRARPVESLETLAALETECDRLRRESPLIADGTVDVVVSNCVLNLVRPQDKQQLFSELYRILKPGGRAVISDIVSDRRTTPEMVNNPELWSGCISGAFQQEQFLEMFAEAGFYGIEILQRQAEPWQVVDGIEFRSLTVRALKEPEFDLSHAARSIIYCGPWQSVRDDLGNVFDRGRVVEVSDRVYRRLSASPYAEEIISIGKTEQEEKRSSCCG